MKTILLVEDDENDVLFFRHALKKATLDVHLEIAVDGQNAIDYLEASHRDSGRVPCLVLLDLNLPKKPAWTSCAGFVITPFSKCWS